MRLVHGAVIGDLKMTTNESYTARPPSTKPLAAAWNFAVLAVAVGAPQIGISQTYDPALLTRLVWRNVGPFHGGRATTGVGVAGNRQLYYMGSTGGGVWKSENGGQSWTNISDQYFNTGSIGDIAVFASDARIIYVGTGEAPVRGQMSSYGDGVYKSTDAGKTWKHIGLEKTMQIARVVIHPTNPNLLYVAAQGNRWVPSEDRGIYRSADGGATWKRILFSSNLAGASELQMDPYDPNVLYAAFWDHQRLPWMDRSGGPGSGVWKSTDGGEHWMQLKTGLPKIMGKIRLAVSPANNSRIYAAIETEKSGLFVSDDAGQNWRQVSDAAGFATRPWYYMGIAADPKAVDTVYLSTASLLKSTDGGKTFSELHVHHGDTHTLWINPTEPKNMIDTDDGGAEVSFDGGMSWSPIDNQPTAQLYTVRADDLFPYNLYSGQQDTTAVKVASRTFGGVSAGANWRSISNSEAARPSFDPKNPRVIFTPNYQGTLTRTEMDTGLAHDVSPWPGQKLGYDASQMTWRFEWSPPSIWSPFDARTIYLGANVLFRSTDQGNTWDVISPDLTRNDRKKHGRSGLFWHDGSGGEIYDTIYAIAESPHERGTIWVGTDDGVVQLTHNGGASWTNVTPHGAPEGWVYTIEVSPHDKGTAYVTLSAHRTGDFTPYFYKTTDYGKTWTDLAAGLPQNGPARVLREDPVRKGLLYAATEYAMWISFDDGAHWQSFQQNLPHVPISDLLVHDSDLIVSTEGRGFWIVDDLTTLRQMTAESAAASLSLFKPRDTYRIPASARGEGDRGGGPVNPPAGVVIRYSLAQALNASTGALRLEILDAGGAVVRSYTYPEISPPKDAGAPASANTQISKADEGTDFHERQREHSAPGRDKDRGTSTGAEDPPAQRGEPQAETAQRRSGNGLPKVGLTAGRGLNQLVWDFREAPVADARGDGPMVPSGHYTVRMTLGSKILSQAFELVPDPRLPGTADAEKERMLLTRHIMEITTVTNATFNELRDVLAQARNLEQKAKAKPSGSRDRALGQLIDELERLEKRFQPPAGPKGPGGQLVLSLGMGPVDRFGPVQAAIDTGEGPITQGDRLRAKELEALCLQVRKDADKAMTEELPRVNALISASGLEGAITRHPGVAAPAASDGQRDAEELEDDDDRT